MVKEKKRGARDSKAYDKNNYDNEPLSLGFLKRKLSTGSG